MNQGISLDPNSKMSEVTILGLLSPFRTYCTFEWGIRSRTAHTYATKLRWLAGRIGDINPLQLRAQHLADMKRALAETKHQPASIHEYVSAVKAFLRFCREALNLDTLHPREIVYPRMPKRQVVYLTPDEVVRFIAAIPVNGHGKTAGLHWLSFRALVEVLLGTGIRISECLSLKRSTLRWDSGTAQIIGKGNKQRTIFFTPRALAWVERYLKQRQSSADYIFVGPSGRPLRPCAIQRTFRVIRARAGLAKNVTPHILRHTVATTLLFNGCPIGHIKEILGHEDLQTTCEYYLGTDNHAAKAAHDQYLEY